MKNKAFASRALSAIRHPVFFRHFLEGRRRLPRQAAALRALDDCMARCRGLSTTETGAGKERRVSAFEAAGRVSAKPNGMACVEVEGMEKRLGGLASKRGVRLELGISPASGTAVVHSEYAGIAQALLDFSGAGSGGRLTLARSTRGNLVIFLQAGTCEKRDEIGLALLERMAAATGGSLVMADRGSERVCRLVLPARFGV